MCQEMIIFLIKGGITQGFEFHINEDTEIIRSCSAMLNGEFFIFGGTNFKRQLSKVAECGLKRIGDLSFEFYRGAYGTFPFH